MNPVYGITKFCTLYAKAKERCPDSPDSAPLLVCDAFVVAVQLAIGFTVAIGVSGFPQIPAPSPLQR